nr:MAG TPA: hypothetical protein [Caudoviricetes sp.]
MSVIILNTIHNIAPVSAVIIVIVGAYFALTCCFPHTIVYTFHFQ